MSEYLPKIIGKTINGISHLNSKYAAKLAITIFSTPQKGKIIKKESAYLKSAEQDYVNFENISIKTYNWKGKKDTILLVHGWESNTYRWKDLIEILKPLGYNIVALDAPAHGDSGSKLFNALLYSECIHIVAKKFNASTIIGHSVGGMATVFTQHKYQLKTIGKIILLGSPADFTGVFKRYSLMMGYNKKVTKAMNSYVLKHFNHLPEHFSPANFSKDFKAKGLVIHDKKDRIIPYKDGLKFKNNFTNSEFISTKGFGHSLKSDIVYQHILDFLKA